MDNNTTDINRDISRDSDNSHQMGPYFKWSVAHSLRWMVQVRSGLVQLPFCCQTANNLGSAKWGGHHEEVVFRLLISHGCDLGVTYIKPTRLWGIPSRFTEEQCITIFQHCKSKCAWRRSVQPPLCPNLTKIFWSVIFIAFWIHANYPYHSFKYLSISLLKCVL